MFRVGFRVFRVGFRVFRVGSGCSGWGSGFYRHPDLICFQRSGLFILRGGGERKGRENLGEGEYERKSNMWGGGGAPSACNALQFFV